MLNPFPDLLVFSLLAPLIIRVTVGIYFIVGGFLKLRKGSKSHSTNKIPLIIRKAFLWLSILGGIFVLLGFYTQIGSLLLLTTSLYYLLIREDNWPVYVLLFAMSLSLLFTGAGFLAFDYPL